MPEPISLEQERELAAGYVMDDLTVEETELFEQLLLEKPYLRQNVRLLQESFGSIPNNLTLTAPPPDLKGKIFAEIATETARETVTASSSEAFKPRSRSPWRKIAAILAALGAIVLVVDNFRLRQALQYAELEKEKSSEAVANIMQQGTSRLISLKAEDGGNESKGSLMFTPGKWETVILSLQNLPPLPADEVYRLWLTLENDTTIPCGEFNTNEERKIFVKLNPPQQPPKGVKATGMFVTIDRKDAPLQPTGKRILSGKIAKLS